MPLLVTIPILISIRCLLPSVYVPVLVVIVSYFCPCMLNETLDDLGGLATLQVILIVLISF